MVNIISLLWKTLVGICLWYTSTRTRLHINQECIARRQTLAYILMHTYYFVCIFKRCILFLFQTQVCRSKANARTMHEYQTCNTLNLFYLFQVIFVVFLKSFSCSDIHVVAVEKCKETSELRLFINTKPKGPLVGGLTAVVYLISVV